MSTAEIAIAISLLSVFCAALSLGWNIYRDVVLKPKVKVDFEVVNHAYPNPFGKQEGMGEFIRIFATNHGPGVVIINSIYVMDTSLWKKVCGKAQRWLVDYRIISSESKRLPKRLEFGEDIMLLLLYDEECFLSRENAHIGVGDTFGRVHWAEWRSVVNARRKWLRDFDGKIPPDGSNG